MGNRWTRTDLALEAGELHGGLQNEMPGVLCEQHTYTEYKIQVTEVTIEDEQGEQLLQKKKGHYITIESEWLKENHLQAHQEILKLVVRELQKFISGYETTLVIGLGNRRVTADALGPLVVDRLLVTRHMMELVPDDLKGRLSTVCAVAPGVMGQTGMETGDILQGILEKIRPDLVIAIDALATSSIHRMNSTIQISDAGVSPGAGMGNYRQVLSKENLGIPVLAVGIPTVIDAATMVSGILEETGGTADEKMDKHLMELTGMLYVTPKDMDVVLFRTANLLAGAINQTLHQLTHEEMQEYLY